ncbi:MAG: hypothetical protein IT464_02430 [Planctomycetes bacterium]|nr:hypothetical protein [Planctomycetota bacterium]
MSTITCKSCGMQYDGTGLQAGVQFQCTQCGSMVAVGGAGAPAGGKRPTARQRKTAGPAGPKAARGPMPARAAGGPPQRRGAAQPVMGQPGHDPNQQQQGYGPPVRKKSNAGLFVGLGVGLVVLVLIVVVVVMSSGPSPEQQQDTAREDEAKKKREEAARRDAETLKNNEAVMKPVEASKGYGRAIESALRTSDVKTLAGMFDWKAYALYNGDLAKKDEQYLKSPLIADGEWEKGADGRYTGRYLGTAARGPESLNTRVMGYIENYLMGSANITWDEGKTNLGLEKSGFKLQIGGTEYLGLKVFIDIKDQGKTKEFWVGAPRGSTDVVILNFIDPGMQKKLQEKEAKNERGTDNRDPYNDQRDPKNPERDPKNPDNPPDPDNPQDPPLDPDADLPAVAKTGVAPKDAALVNCISDLKRIGALNEARKDTIRKTTDKAEKKAVMGAVIDILIDAVNSKDRTLKQNASRLLYDIWKNFCAAEWKEDDLVYKIDFGGAQSDSDMTVRRWLWTYNNYKTD